MFTKFHVSIPADTLRAVEARAGKNDRSGTIARALDRYFHICARARASLRDTFNEAERGALLDATAGAWTGDLVSARLIAATVQDAIEHDGIAPWWAIDGAALCAKVGALDDAHAVALVDALEQHRAEKARGAALIPGDLFT